MATEVPGVLVPAVVVQTQVVKLVIGPNGAYHPLEVVGSGGC